MNPSQSTPGFDLPRSVHLIEVLPRDGLQCLPHTYDTDQKLWLIERLVAAGLRAIEVTAFAHPRVIPQLRDADDLLPRLRKRGHAGVELRALVPNLRGAERAAAAGVDTIVALMTATESYSRKNQNRGVEEVLEEITRVVAFATDERIDVEVNVGTAFFDPYEGPTPYERLHEVIATIRGCGVDSVGIAASVGLADPTGVMATCGRLRDDFPGIDLGLHVHNTNGMGLANVLAALQAGVARFESSTCGIGGGIVMPPGMSSLSGNVPTEDLAHMLAAMGIDTGLDPAALVACARDVSETLDLPLYSYTARGGTRDEIVSVS